jgi:hypothetical protein
VSLPATRHRGNQKTIEVGALPRQHDLGKSGCPAPRIARATYCRCEARTVTGLDLSSREIVVPSAIDKTAADRTEVLLAGMRDDCYCSADQLFTGLMPLQWLAAVIVASWLGPRTIELISASFRQCG